MIALQSRQGSVHFQKEPPFFSIPFRGIFKVLWT